MSIYHTCRFLRRIYLDTFASRSKLSRLLPRSAVYTDVRTRVYTRSATAMATTGGRGDDPSRVASADATTGENILLRALCHVPDVSARGRNTTGVRRLLFPFARGVFHRPAPRASVSSLRENVRTVFRVGFTLIPWRYRTAHLYPLLPR